MYKSYFIGLLGLLLIGMSACTKYDPIYGVANNEPTPSLSLKKDLVYIHDNDVYLVNEILSEEQKLTNTPSSTKTHVVISPNLDRIAYLNANKIPVIIDVNGAVIETLSQYSNATDIKWHPNNGDPVLVILRNNTLYYYGSTLSIGSNPFFVFPNDATFTAVDAIDIDENYNVVFTYRYQRPYSSTSSLRRYYHGVAINYYSSSSLDEKQESYDGYYNPATTSYSAQSYDYYYFAKINKRNQTVTIGSTKNGLQNNISSYDLHYYQYAGSSNFVNSLNTQLSLTAESYYIGNTTGYVASNPYQIRKYLDNLPAGVPPPTGTPNTYTINFSNQNNTAPTYIDWSPQ